MSFHDAWARRTPYEIGIPGRTFADRGFAAIREEAEARDVDARHPGTFFQLGEVGRLIREIQGGAEGADAIERFAAFLFQAYHFHRAGERLLLLSEAVARTVVEERPEGATWEGALPAEAGYLQLPRHLFWSHPAEEGPAEPIDGMFWTRGPADTVALMVAMGVRGGRPGLAVTELPPLPLADAGTWLTGGNRSEGEDFRTTLPGGELDGLYSLVTLGEVLTLFGRVFARLARTPDLLGPEARAPSEPSEGPEAGGPVPSALPFRRIGGS